MAYDEDFAMRLRELVAAEPDIAEKAMFGGLAFLVGGHMAFTASGRGGMMVRVDPEQCATLIARTPASPTVMGGREMRGWLSIAPEHLRTKRQLVPWVERSVAFARTLPPKAARKRPSPHRPTAS